MGRRPKGLFDVSTLAGRIAAARELAGIKNQTVLAERVGTDQGQVSKWETGAEAPGVPYLQAISAALGVSIDWLVNGPPTSLHKEEADRARAAQDEADALEDDEQAGGR